MLPEGAERRDYSTPQAARRAVLACPVTAASAIIYKTQSVTEGSGETHFFAYLRQFER